MPFLMFDNFKYYFLVFLYILTNNKLYRKIIALQILYLQHMILFH
jgi:hypothetical protein